MRRSILLMILTVLATVLASVPALAQNPYEDVDPLRTDRLSGPERIATSVDVSQEYATQRPEALLVRSDDFADSLAGTVLATAADGPLLLTRPEGLTQGTADELVRIMEPGGTVFLAGGVDALSAQVEDDVAALGFTTQRVEGPTRYDTSVAMARLANDTPQRIYVADGNAFEDALIAGHTAARDDFATMVLTDGMTVPDLTAEYLEENVDVEIVAVGPVAASTDVADRSIVGEDQYETSRLAAESLGTDPDDNRVAFASGRDFPDALSGGTHAALTEQPMLLVDPDGLPDTIAGYLQDNPPSTITVYGGVNAIPADVIREAAGNRARGLGNATVFVNEEAPVDAQACENADGDIEFRWSESELTLQRTDGQATGMEVRAAGRDGQTDEIRREQVDADDVSALTGIFDTTMNDGTLREVTVAYNVGIGLCE